MRIIDIHAHVFPEKIALKASEAIGGFYGILMECDGTVSSLLEAGRKCGIGTFVIHSVATMPHQVKAINDFIADTARQYPDRFVGFATLHPGYASIEREVDRVVALGLRGIKIHPDFQKFLVDSKEAMKIYETIEGRLPILVHCGDYRYENSKARRIVSVMKRFPKLRMICAHLGGWSEWEESATVLESSDVFVDTSSSLFKLTPRQARRIIDRYGVDRVLFGTDYPMWSPEHELELIGSVELTTEERDKIMHENAERLFGF